MKKRLVSAVLALVFCLSAAACSGPQPTEEDTNAVMAAVDKFAACQSFTVRQQTNSTEAVTADGTIYTYEGSNTMELSMITSPQLQMKTGNTTSVKADEGLMEQSTISYLFSENGQYTEYFSDGSKWYKVSSDDGSMLDGFNARAFASAFFVDVISFYKAGEDNVDGVSAVRYEGSLGGSVLVEMLETIGYFNSNNVSAMSENQQNKIKNNLAKDLQPVTVKVWVDEAGYPVRFEVSLTEMLKGLEDSISKTLGDKSISDWAITEYDISMSVSDINALSEIELPEEAKSAEVYELPEGEAA